MSGKIDLPDTPGYTNLSGRRTYSYCDLNNPKINKKLSSNIGDNDTEDQIVYKTIYYKLSKRVRDFIDIKNGE